jgi:DNA repair protein RecO (recombination protein O)
LPLRGRVLFSGLYANELLCRLLQRDDPQPELFADYERVVAALAAGQLPDIALRHFELQLLRELGYGFSLTEDADTGAALAPERWYRFDAERGLLPAAGAAGPPLFAGRDLLDFADGEYSDAARRALKQLCRQALRPHLGDKPLLSRQLFAGEGG